MRAYERLLEYVKVPTQSKSETGTVPSTVCQFDLAKRLVSEMKKLGITDAKVDEKCYVTGTIPASEGCEDKPAIGFIAHMDTAPDFSGEHVNPQVHENYDGGIVPLGDGRVLDPEMFPHLKELTGRTLITTDGTTLLGADDKAGIAVIMTLAERILCTDLKDMPHGKVCIAFTPDEEVGGGADDLDLEAFGARYGFTMDGSAENAIEYENFNAAGAVFTVQGRAVHPGEAKNRMVNAGLVACEINSMLPAAEIPAKTEGYEGFYHLTNISGNLECAKVSYIVRDHDSSLFEAKLKTLRLIEKTLNEKYGAGTVTLEIREQYRNMIEKIRPCMHLVETAKAAIAKNGMIPCEVPIRGGTDGARLSFRGLPCPNLGAGGYAFHGPYEHCTAEGMDQSVNVIAEIVRSYGA